MLIVLHAHIIAAANVIQSLNATVTDDVKELAKVIVTNYVRLPRIDGQEAETSEDKVYIYATELLSLGLLWHSFHDSVREADGDRILRYWKILLVLFKSSNSFNYAKEAVTFLIQYYYIFSERQRTQLLWSRCINTKGFPGANIPCDLYMEHLNRRLKIIVRLMGANVTPKAIQKAGKAIASVQYVCQLFEQQTAKYVHNDHHSVPSFGKNFRTILKVLEEEQVFVSLCTRQHNTFHFNCTLIERYSALELQKRIENSIKQVHFL